MLLAFVNGCLMLLNILKITTQSAWQKKKKSGPNVNSNAVEKSCSKSKIFDPDLQNHEVLLLSLSSAFPLVTVFIAHYAPALQADFVFLRQTKPACTSELSNLLTPGSSLCNVLLQNLACLPSSQHLDLYSHVI